MLSFQGRGKRVGCPASLRAVCTGAVFEFRDKALVPRFIVDHPLLLTARETVSGVYPVFLTKNIQTQARLFERRGGRRVYSIRIRKDGGESAGRNDGLMGCLYNLPLDGAGISGGWSMETSPVQTANINLTTVIILCANGAGAWNCHAAHEPSAVRGLAAGSGRHPDRSLRKRPFLKGIFI
jgi:hypothetical protein